MKRLEDWTIVFENLILTRNKSFVNLKKLSLFIMNHIFKMLIYDVKSQKKEKMLSQKKSSKEKLNLTKHVKNDKTLIKKGLKSDGLTQCQFHQHFTQSLYALRSQKCKK